jgi:hypothetical protein
MSQMVEATLPANQFALHATFERYPEATFEVVRLVAEGTDRLMPFVWTAGTEMDELLDALQQDPSTDNVELLAEFDEESLLRMEWKAHIRVILYILLEENATIIDAVGKHTAWRFRILFPEHEAVSTTHEFCEEYDIDLEFERIYQLSDSFRRGQYGLSEQQYEPLVRASQEGYYDIPRGIELQELAEQLDVSHQSLSERLRRGHGTLVANTLYPDQQAPMDN